jgi:cytochrome c-type biogenesis protein
MTADISWWLAFAAGLLSFVSPCTLPLFPSYLGYITGVSFTGPARGPATGPAGDRPVGLRRRAFLHALCFCAGLSVLFIMLGWGASAAGRFLIQYKQTVRVIGGVLVILFGLFMAGVLRSEWLMRERRFQLPARRPLGYLGSVLVGVAFAAGWTPCIGPIVGSVLAMIIAHPAAGAGYMFAYAAGFSLPFLVFAVTLASVRPLLRYTEAAARVGGVLLTVMGVLLLTGQLSVLALWIQRLTGFTGF